MMHEKQLTVQSQEEMLSMAKLFVESKMFPDMSAVGMAFVKIQAGKEIGISPFASMSGIHIIKGKATIGAGLMAGCVKGSGKYDYIVKEMSDQICVIEFMQQSKKIGVSTFTIAEAKKAGTQNLEKFPKNMLFARAMSNGVKWFCPDVFTMPVYTPEELGDPNFTEDITHEEVTAEVKTDTILNNIEKETDIEKLATYFKSLSSADQKKYAAATKKRKEFLTPTTDATKITDEPATTTAQ